MSKGQSNSEFITLIVMAIIAIAFSGWLIVDSRGFAESLKLPAVTEKKDFGAVPIESATAAIQRLTETFKPWTSPVRSNKPVHLNKSVLLVKKDDKIFDLFVEDPLLRAPMSNEFLRKNSLAYLSPNVGEMDPDKDGFTNLEEFQRQTNPRGAQSHPPVTDKLYLVQRISHDFLIVLKSSSPPYQVFITPTDGKRKGFFVEEGKPFGAGVGERFVGGKFEKKVVPDPKTGEKDVSELLVDDKLQNKKLTLIKDVEQNLAEYEAKLEFRLGLTIQSITEKKGGTFRLKGHDATTYKIIDIQDDNAVISPLDEKGIPGKEIVIKKG